MSRPKKLSDAERRQNQRKSADRYNREHMAVVGCKLKKDTAEEYRQWCKDNGTTPNEHLKRYVLDTIAHEPQKNTLKEGETDGSNT